jgi:CRISPR-associated protein Csm2
MTIHTMMTADESGKELVELAQQLAQTLVRNGLTRAQIRNIFTEVRQIEAMWQMGGEHKADALRRLNMLRPKLAYQTARSNAVKDLQISLSAAIDEVEKAPADGKDKAFKRFMDFFEAVLAYHRAEGGRN